MLSEKPWTIERMLMMVFSMILCACLVGLLQGAVLHISGQKKFDENSISYVIFLILILHGSILAATAFVMLWCQLNWRQAFGIFSWSTNRSIFWGAMAGLIFLPVGILLQFASQQLLTLLKYKVTTQEALKTLADAHNPVNRALLIVFAAIIAPVAEEVLFRGILYPAIRRLGFPRIALWTTSILFAAIHADWAIFVPLLALGLGLALLYERADNLLAPITAHAVFNSINLIGFYWLGWSDKPAPGWIHLFGS